MSHAYTMLEVRREDGCGWITLNRPDRLNALTGDMRHSAAMDLDTTLEWEAQAIAMALQTPEAREAFAAFQRSKAG